MWPQLRGEPCKPAHCAEKPSAPSIRFNMQHTEPHAARAASATSAFHPEMAPPRPGAPGGPPPGVAPARHDSPVVLSPPSTSGQATPVPAGDTPLRRWTTAQLAAATNNFDPARLLGEGGYGEVYRADLPDGSVVAVKRMGADSTEGEAGFLAEVGVTGAVSHPHVLPVLGVVRAC